LFKKGSEVARDMTNTVKKADVSMSNKLRMMLLYIVTQTGLKTENISSLSATAGFGPAEAKALESLKYFGFDISKPRDKKKKGVLELLGVGNKPAERAQYELSRYVPPLKTLLLELANNALDKEQFPFLIPAEEVKDKIGATKRGPASLVPAAWGEGNNNNNNNNNSQSVTAAADTRDVIVFVIGGLSYSECRVAYEVLFVLFVSCFFFSFVFQVAAELGRPVFVGSTTVYQPNEFVRQLQHLANPHPPPNLRIERLGGKVQNHG
jgi:syntaxin-binding protein 1